MLRFQLSACSEQYIICCVTLYFVQTNHNHLHDVGEFITLVTIYHARLGSSTYCVEVFKGLLFLELFGVRIPAFAIVFALTQIVDIFMSTPHIITSMLTVNSTFKILWPIKALTLVKGPEDNGVFIAQIAKAELTDLMMTWIIINPLVSTDHQLVTQINLP